MISKLTCHDGGIKARWARGPKGGLYLATSIAHDLDSDDPLFHKWEWSGPKFEIPGPLAETKDGTE